MGRRRTLIYGVGVNDSESQISWMENGVVCRDEIYDIWRGMLMRCYSKKYHLKTPTYIDCVVSDDWLYFSNFKKWAINKNWKGMQLDKDILYQNNKRYSAETCVFVSGALNALLNCNSIQRGKLPIGVSFEKTRGVFQSHCKSCGKQNNLGHHKDPMKAHAAWQKAKAEVIERAAQEQKDQRIKDALMIRVYQLRNDLANGRETTKL